MIESEILKFADMSQCYQLYTDQFELEKAENRSASSIFISDLN